MPADAHYGVSFAYASPSHWNSLPAYLGDNSVSLSSFKRTSKPFSSLSTRLAYSARLGFFYKKNVLYKFTIIVINMVQSNITFFIFAVLVV